jgi:hypothetical protein
VKKKNISKEEAGALWIMDGNGLELVTSIRLFLRMV